MKFLGNSGKGDKEGVTCSRRQGRDNQVFRDAGTDTGDYQAGGLYHAEAVYDRMETSDNHVGGGPYFGVGAITGLGLGTSGWYDEDGSRNWAQGRRLEKRISKR